MESPPRVTTTIKPKTPGSVTKLARKVMGSAKKRRHEKDDKSAKRHKSSNDFEQAMVLVKPVKSGPQKTMKGATKMLTELALNSPKLASDKIKKARTQAKNMLVGTPMKMAGLMKRNKSNLYSRTPKGETRAVNEWNKRLVRKEVPNENSRDHELWSDSKWAQFHPQLTLKEIRLQEVFNEFILKELAYTASIKQIRTVYMKAFSTCDFSQFDETPDEIAEDLFANINEIVDLQERFAKSLSDLRGRSNGLIRNFGNFFTEWLSKFGPYVPYCGHIGAMKKRYDSLLDKSEEFLRLVKQLQLMEQCEKKDLWTLLDEPRRHFLRYNLMLKAALSHLQKIHADREEDTPEDEDIANLDNSLSVVAEIGEQMNKGVDEIADYLTMRSLRNNLHFTNEEEREGFAIPENSVLLFHGMLTNRDGKGIHAFLGSHFLVFTRESRRSGRTTYQVPRGLKPVNVKDLDVRLVEQSDPGALSFGRTGSMLGRNRQSTARKNNDDHLSMMHVIDHNDKAIYTLKARSQEGRDAWVHAIREVGVVANVKSTQASTSTTNPLKRVQLVDLSLLPSPTQAKDSNASNCPQNEQQAGNAIVGSSPAKCFNLSEKDDQFLQLRSKLKFSENTPHVTPPRQNVRDTFVAEDDVAIRKFDFVNDEPTLETAQSSPSGSVGSVESAEVEREPEPSNEGPVDAPLSPVTVPDNMPEVVDAADEGTSVGEQDNMPEVVDGTSVGEQPSTEQGPDGTEIFEERTEEPQASMEAVPHEATDC